jgi:hypothetical protein
MWQPRRKTVERYGTCRRTIERWEADPVLGFPPCRTINGYKYDNTEALDTWDAACAAAGRAARTPPNAGRAPAKREAAASNIVQPAEAS